MPKHRYPTSSKASIRRSWIAAAALVAITAALVAVVLATGLAASPTNVDAPSPIVTMRTPRTACIPADDRSFCDGYTIAPTPFPVSPTAT